jgi:hypothetical protein
MSTCECLNFSPPIRGYADVLARCEASTAGLRSTLEQVRLLPSEWATLFRCRVCGSFWCEEYPFSEYHGGGSACIYRVEATNDDEQWARSYRPITPQFRQQHEDTTFLQSLGDEVGPELCQRPGCGRPRIRNSVMCRRHHFEMLKHRECPV